MRYKVGMYIARIPNRNSPPAILLREGYREHGKVKSKTIANISHWPREKIDLLQRVLKGDKLVGVDDLFESVSSFHHGHVRAVLTAIRRLGLAEVIAPRRSRERDLAVAMIAAQVLAAQSKLAYTRWWHTTTLPTELGVADANEDELYEALDWLLEHQERIEKKLALRHLSEGGLVLFDLTSSYFEGKTCPLAKLGYNRDGKKGKLQVNYGLLANGKGCPVAVSVYSGNTGDPKTLLPAVQTLKERFHLSSLVLVGDRGMIGQKQIDTLCAQGGVDWITALKTSAIRPLVVEGHIQIGLFDEKNLFELTHPDYPGERLVACRNPELARLRAHKRRDLIAATTAELEKVRTMVDSGKLQGAAKIGVRVGKVVNKYKVAKHFVLDVKQGGFNFHLDEQKVAQEAALDGIYVIRTSLSRQRMSSQDAVRGYKMLTEVERAFRSLKTMDLHVRPIRHRREKRVKGHLLLCMLAYYVQWHMVEALRPLLFADEEQERKATRDPVAPVHRSDSATLKAATKALPDGSEVHSFRTLLTNLSGIVKNYCRRRGTQGAGETTIIVSTPSDIQRKTFDLLEAISV